MTPVPPPPPITFCVACRMAMAPSWDKPACLHCATSTIAAAVHLEFAEALGSGILVWASAHHMAGSTVARLSRAGTLK